MNSVYKKQFRMIKKYLDIENAISIRFSDTKPKNYKKYKDTACTVLARSLKRGVSTYLDRKEGQLCPGGNYFLNITRPTKKEICDIYVKEEKVFQDNAVCGAFLKGLPRYSALARKRYVLFTPLAKEIRKPDVIMLLATPAEASRILGLSVYQKMSVPSVIPAISTCASIYAPVVLGKIHINFIDYYDRYFQGRQKGELFWEDNQMIISLPFSIFKKIVEYIPLSAHGSHKPKIKSQEVDPL